MEKSIYMYIKLANSISYVVDAILVLATNHSICNVLWGVDYGYLDEWLMNALTIICMASVSLKIKWKCM
jgi:hypothetical protein